MSIKKRFSFVLGALMMLPLHAGQHGPAMPHVSGLESSWHAFKNSYAVHLITQYAIPVFAGIGCYCAFLALRHFWGKRQPPVNQPVVVPAKTENEKKEESVSTDQVKETFNPGDYLSDDDFNKLLSGASSSSRPVSKRIPSLTDLDDDKKIERYTTPSGTSVRIGQFEVAPQEGNTCGYHAAKNTLYLCCGAENKAYDLCKKLQEPINVDAVAAVTVAERVQNAMNKLSQSQLKSSEYQDKAAYDTEIKKIIEMLKASLGVCPKSPIAAIASKDHIVGGIYDATFKEIATAILSEKDYVHGFVLGTMGAHDGDNIGHWISLVLYKHDGKIDYLVADSFNYDRTCSDVVQAVINKVDLALSKYSNNL